MRHGRYYVYMVECADGTYYTGSTNNLTKRITLHNNGHGAKYVRGRGPVKLVYKKGYRYYQRALQAERALKQLTRKQKEALVQRYSRSLRSRRSIMRRIAVGVGLVLGVCAAGGGAEAFSASYDQKVTLGRQVMTSKVSMKDKMFRMDMTAEGQAMATIRNASGTYTYMPAEGMAMKLSALNPSQRPIEHADNYAAYLKERQAERIGTETVDGYPCEMYRFTDPETGDLVTAWVWTEKQFPIKMEIDGAKGKILVEIQNVQLGAALPDALFELPDGVQVMDMGNMFQMGQ